MSVLANVLTLGASSSWLCKDTIPPKHVNVFLQFPPTYTGMTGLPLPILFSSSILSPSRGSLCGEVNVGFDFSPEVIDFKELE
jgi:hypothetical protein